MSVARILWIVVLGLFLVAVRPWATGAQEPKPRPEPAPSDPGDECPPCEWVLLRGVTEAIRKTAVVEEFADGRWHVSKVGPKFEKAAGGASAARVTFPKRQPGVFRMRADGMRSIHVAVAGDECPRPIICGPDPGPPQGVFARLERILFDIPEWPGRGPVEMALEHFDERARGWVSQRSEVARVPDVPGKAVLTAPGDPGIYRLVIKGAGGTAARFVFEVKERP